MELQLKIQFKEVTNFPDFIITKPDQQNVRIFE